MGSEEETWNAAPDSESRHCSNPIPPPHLPAAVASPRHERSSLEVEEDRIEAATISWSNSCLYRHINQEALEVVVLCASGGRRMRGKGG